MAKRPSVLHKYFNVKKAARKAAGNLEGQSRGIFLKKLYFCFLERFPNLRRTSQGLPGTEWIHALCWFSQKSFLPQKTMSEELTQRIQGVTHLKGTGYIVGEYLDRSR